jgi:exonuclease SbcD
LERGGVHLRTRLAELDQPLLLPLDATPVKDGAAGATLAIYGIPWLEPRLVAEPLGVETASHFEVTRAATDLIRADLQRRSALGTVHSVVLAHTFASGGISSDSERDLSIGGVGAVPLDLFDGFSYTALGHLHGRQQLSPQVRYSGSPLAYSFSEAKHQKGGWLIDVGPAGVAGVTELAWKAPRTLAVLRGEITELLESGDHTWAEDAYCQITVTDAQRPAQAMERLRTRFPDTLVLGFDPEGAGAAAKTSYSSRLAEAEDDLSICCGFLEHVRGRTADDREAAVLAEALESVRLEGVPL